MNTDSSEPPRDRALDLEATAQMVERLERDLDRVRSGESGVATLRADVERLRELLASAEPPHQEVHAGLEGLRDSLHGLSDELLDDALKVGDYLTRIGRLLGL
jgi:hypothetical protein